MDVFSIIISCPWKNSCKILINLSDKSIFEKEVLGLSRIARRLLRKELTPRRVTRSGRIWKESANKKWLTLSMRMHLGTKPLPGRTCFRAFIISWPFEFSWWPNWLLGKAKMTWNKKTFFKHLAKRFLWPFDSPIYLRTFRWVRSSA